MLEMLQKIIKYNDSLWENDQISPSLIEEINKIIKQATE
jgi:hypothetical protein